MSNSFYLHILFFFFKMQGPAFYLLKGKILQYRNYKSIFLMLLSPQKLSFEIFFIINLFMWFRRLIWGGGFLKLFYPSQWVGHVSSCRIKWKTWAQFRVLTSKLLHNSTCGSSWWQFTPRPPNYRESTDGKSVFLDLTSFLSSRFIFYLLSACIYLECS